jgi:hypothetical protein
MRYSTQIKPISYLKANAAEVLQERDMPSLLSRGLLGG